MVRQDRSTSVTSDLPHRECNDASLSFDRKPVSSVPVEVKASSSAASTPTEAGFASIQAIDSICGSTKQILKVIDELGFLFRDSSIQIPKIVVIGDQSAGKSSTIEGLTGITVPRDAGTCTRCPVHISLSEGTTWTCEVLLEKVYDYSYDHTGDLGPWMKKAERTCIFFTSVQNPEDVEATIRRAELALLNPTKDPKFFVTADIENMETHQLFSPNVLRLNITAPGFTNLSFFDLPGIIRTTPDATQSDLPALVEALHRQFMKNDTDIILLAVPLSNDIETCSAKSLVKEARAEGRCVGILTKPDRFETGNPLQTVQDILSGRIHKLGYGYFVTRQPSHAERVSGITNTEARALESKYFSSEPPWATVFSRWHHRCGIQNLQTKLSEILVECAKQHIPKLRSEVLCQLDEINTELKSLPEAPNDKALLIVNNSINTIQNHLYQKIRGQFPMNTFLSQWQKLVDSTKQDFATARPELDIPIELSDDDDDDEDTQVPITPNKRGKQPKQSPAQTPNKNNVPIKKESPTKKVKSTKIKALRIPVDVVSRRIDEVSSLTLKNRNDTRAATSFIIQARKCWRDLVIELIGRTAQQLYQEVVGLVEEHLLQWKTTAFYDAVLQCANTMIEGRLKPLKAHIRHILDAELDVDPYTFDYDTLQHHIDQERAIIMQTRPDRQDFEVSKTTKAAMPFVDPYKNEVEVMATVRGYYDLASASLLDQTCKLLQLDLLNFCCANMATHLSEGLDGHGIDALEKCKRLLEQDPQIAQRREHLLRERETFEHGKELLDGICNPDADEKMS